VAIGRYSTGAEAGLSELNFVCAVAADTRIRIRIDDETTCGEVKADFCARHGTLTASLNRRAAAQLSADHVELIASGSLVQSSAVVQRTVRDGVSMVLVMALGDVHVARPAGAAGIAEEARACDPDERWATAVEATKAATATGEDAKVAGIYAQYVRQQGDASAAAGTT
jgi:hypothetical protein